MSTKRALSGGFMVTMAALVPLTEGGVAIASCGYEAGSADLSKCDEDGPGQHGREIFVQVVTSSISTGSIGSTYGAAPVLQVIDAHHVPPPNRWSPVATEPSAMPRSVVTLYGPQAVLDLKLAKGLFKT
jgi:hypothetical protein